MNVLRVLVSSLAATAAVGSTPLPTQQAQIQRAQIQQTPIREAQAAIGNYRIPVHTAEADSDHEYGIWAGARDYKASFHDGMTFIPRLGGDYPHNQPWSWRTTSVRRGERELLDAGEVPVPSGADYRYEYAFGAFTEAYDVLMDGLEQTFVFDTLPGSGDLVITGAVDSLLVTDRAAAAHQELTFRDAAGTAILSYGAAWVLDARGDRLAIPTSHQGGEITLRVPGAWLEQAALPIVVDPILAGAVSIGTAPNGGFQGIDVARDAETATANVMTVWAVFFSSQDSDVFAHLTDDDYTARGLVFTDIASTRNTDAPACAFVGGADRWVVVFRSGGYGSTSRIGCHVRASGDTVPRTTFNTLAAPSGNDWRPDVGGVAGGASGSQALVVFQHENNSGGFAATNTSDVYGSLLDPTLPFGTFGPRIPIAVSQFRDSERPSVNQVAEGGSSWSWICALQTYNNSVFPEDWDLTARRIGSDGTVASGIWASDLAIGGSYHQLQPIVEGSDGRYAVLFATAATASQPGKIANVLGESMWLERLDWAHGSNAPDPAGNQPPVALDTEPTPQLQTVDLAFDTNDESHFVPMWISYSTSTNWPEARYAICGYEGTVTEGPAALSPYVIRGGACTFDNDAGEFRIVLFEDAGLAGRLIYGISVGYVQPAPTTLSGTGCSPITLDWLGNQQIGSETERLVATGAPPGTGHFVLAALAPANQPIVNPAVASGCHLLVSNGPGYLGGLDFQVGSNPSWPFALPSWLPPTTLYFQDWVFDGNQFAATQRLEVPVVR